HTYLQRYSRRRKGGAWSRINVERAEALTAAGRMRPPGLAEVAAAKADGRWDAAYTSQRDAAVPPDLAEALAARPRAAARFAALGNTARYQLILPLLKARTPATRPARLTKTITDLDHCRTPPRPRAPARPRCPGRPQCQRDLRRRRPKCHRRRSGCDPLARRGLAPLLQQVGFRGGQRGGMNSGWSRTRSQLPSGWRRTTCARAPAPSLGGVEVSARSPLTSVGSGSSGSNRGRSARTFSHNRRIASRPTVCRPGG